MKNSKQKKKQNLSVFAGITGAIVGAGAAIAGTLFLKDKKNRDKVKKAFVEVKNKTETYIKKAEKKVEKKVAKKPKTKKSTK